MTPLSFTKMLKSHNSIDTFNPYSNICDTFDISDAPEIRSRTLQQILEAATNTEVDAIWIGRDLGHRGGRRTGLALTDETHAPLHTKRWGIDIRRATKGDAVSERTATVIWSILAQIEEPIFLWNVFPFHPHEKNNPFSNRAHTSSERKTGEEILTMLVDLLSPRRIVAVGNDAYNSALRLSSNIEIYKVRHPSYGGHKDFVQQISEIYNLKNLSSRQGQRL
ncbi:MAG: uracil-DNA glycosylase [Gammaproteobacteria bacterium]|nr:uracil-DNA glycosylase [Gammaproteobacteria bacterium]